MQMIVIIFVLLFLNGVFGVEVKTVMEGDSVTLQTEDTEVHRAGLIRWTFGPESTRIAQINTLFNIVSYYDVPDGRFRNRLKLDHQTGSLTITDIRTEHAGLYGYVQFIGTKEVSHKKFSITVSARLPVPVISRNSLHCSSSSSSCSLLCSVVNVSHVTLSWFKGNSVLSSISVSDLSISLSLSLEVDYFDKNTYSCVLNNSFTNHTTHLDISQLCQPCSAPGLFLAYIMLVCVCSLAVVALFCGGLCYLHKISTQAANQGQLDGEGHFRLTNGVVNGNAGNANQPMSACAETPDQERLSQNSDFIERDEMTLISANVGETVTLPANVTEIQENELIRWKYAKSREYHQAEFSVIAKWDKTNNEENLGDEERFKDRLQLDHDTGSLTITNITPKHYGHYKLHINSEGRKITKTFSVASYDKKKRWADLEEKNSLLPSVIPNGN